MNRRIALLFLAGLALSGCSLLPSEPELPVVEIATPVLTQREVITVTRGRIERRESLWGTVGLAEQAPGYFRAAGRITALHVAPGDFVRAGTLLAELDSGFLPTDVALAELDVEKVRVRWERTRLLAGFDDVNAQWEFRTLDLELRQAQIRLDRVREQLAETRLYAPRDGYVISVTAAEGDRVNAFDTILHLGFGEDLVVRTAVDEFTAARLLPGQRVEVMVHDGFPTPVTGVVLSVGQGSLSEVPQGAGGAGGAGMLQAVIKVNPAPGRLRLGQFVRAEVVTDVRENALLLPQSAIREFRGRSFVTVVEEQGRRETSVEIGLSDDRWVEIVSGLREGEGVIGR